VRVGGGLKIKEDLRRGRRLRIRKRGGRKFGSDPRQAFTRISEGRPLKITSGTRRGEEENQEKGLEGSGGGSQNDLKDRASSAAKGRTRTKKKLGVGFRRVWRVRGEKAP